MRRELFAADLFSTLYELVVFRRFVLYRRVSGGEGVVPFRDRQVPFPRISGDWIADDVSSSRCTWI